MASPSPQQQQPQQPPSPVPAEAQEPPPAAAVAASSPPSSPRALRPLRSRPGPRPRKSLKPTCSQLSEAAFAEFEELARDMTLDKMFPERLRGPGRPNSESNMHFNLWVDQFVDYIGPKFFGDGVGTAMVWLWPYNRVNIRSLCYRFLKYTAQRQRDIIAKRRRRTTLLHPDGQQPDQEGLGHPTGTEGLNPASSHHRHHAASSSSPRLESPYPALHPTKQMCKEEDFTDDLDHGHKEYSFHRIKREESTTPSLADIDEFPAQFPHDTKPPHPHHNHHLHPLPSPSLLPKLESHDCAAQFCHTYFPSLILHPISQFFTPEIADYGIAMVMRRQEEMVNNDVVCAAAHTEVLGEGNLREWALVRRKVKWGGAGGVMGPPLKRRGKMGEGGYMAGGGSGGGGVGSVMGGAAGCHDHDPENDVSTDCQTERECSTRCSSEFDLDC